METFWMLPDGGGNVEIKLGKYLGGKGIVLTFWNKSEDSRTEPVFAEICAWIQKHNSWILSPLHKDVKASHAFIQSRSEDYLMLEFWTDKKENVIKLAELLRGRFEFNYQLTEDML